jgi:sodium-dependent phosphate cotransporter
VSVKSSRVENLTQSQLLRTVSIIALLFIFLLGVRGLGEGFELLGGNLLERFFQATANPFIGLIVGLLATTIMQSSSVTTAMIVALVAAPQFPLPLGNAVPMVMGANIGTTITATIVSLAHVGRREEFRRAFPVAVCHDIFNYFAVLVLLPLELMTGFLQKSAVLLGSLVEGTGGVTYQSPIRAALVAGYAPIETTSKFLFTIESRQAVFLIAFSGVIIYVSLYLLVRVMRAVASSRIETMMNNVLGSHALLSMLIGALVTVMVQSSSITTSLLVPLAAAGVLRLEQAFPVTLGANLGTTVTAFLAALAVSGPNAAAGLEIALVHLLFNFTGIVLIFPLAAVRQVPLRFALSLTSLAIKSPKIAVLCIGAAFYGIPGLVLLLSSGFN